MKKLLSAALTVAALFSGASKVQAEGWSLNPFSSFKPKTTTTQLMAGRPINYGKHEPSTWEKTKQFFSKTTDAVTPSWAKSNKPKKKAKPKKSWFASDPPPKARTVSEWLGQDRLDP